MKAADELLPLLNPPPCPIKWELPTRATWGDVCSRSRHHSMKAACMKPFGRLGVLDAPYYVRLIVQTVCQFVNGLARHFVGKHGQNWEQN